MTTAFRHSLTVSVDSASASEAKPRSETRRPRKRIYARFPSRCGHAPRSQESARDNDERSRLSSFDALGLAEPLLQAVSAEGFQTPTQIQTQVIPAMLAGQDVLGTAQTGTGKTAAFVLPLLDRLKLRDANTRPQPKSCRSLILAPTRELAAQIVDSIRTLGRPLRPSVALVVGGARPEPQVRALARGVDILVATPGRLLDHLGAGVVRLDQVSTLVLDEADQMLDLGFLPAIRKVVAAVPTARQTVLLSATMPKPIRGLAHELLTNPAEIAVGPVARPIDRIEQRVLHVEAATKRRVLLEVLADPAIERAIVFTRTKRGADHVSRNLQGAGHDAAAIHGNKTQRERERTLAAFRAGSVKLLVATDIAARGIDVEGVSHVVNYDMPAVPEAYVHRIGRTARAGRSGIAISLCDEAERGLLRGIERLIGRSLSGRPQGSPTPSGRSSGGPTPNEAKPTRPVPAGPAPAGPSRRPRTPSRSAPTNRWREQRPADEAPDAGLARMLQARESSPARGAAPSASVKTGTR